MKPYSDYGPPTWALTAIENVGITWRDFKKLSPEEQLKIPGIGKAALKEIQEICKAVC